MKIAVIGAGIIGVTTAFELGRDGHDVTVFERRSAAAEETSFAIQNLPFDGVGGKVIAKRSCEPNEIVCQLLPSETCTGIWRR